MKWEAIVDPDTAANPYFYMAAVLVLLSVMFAAWALTPWFPWK